MSHKLVLATRNQGKITEFRRILEELAPGQIELIGVDKFPDLVDVEETGTSFEENSLLKARYTSQATGLPAIADDSGLCVDALNGDPGIFSARWAGVHGNDQANLIGFRYGRGGNISAGGGDDIVCFLDTLFEIVFHYLIYLQILNYQLFLLVLILKKLRNN